MGADMMQVARFNNGGFMLHKVATFDGSTVFSAWYDPEGNLLDTERKDGRKMTLLDTRKAEQLGKVWRN